MNHSNIAPFEVEGLPPQLPVGQPGGPPVEVRMIHVPGKPGTCLGLALRCTQLVSAAISLAVMLTTHFTTVPALSFHVAAAGMGCMWSFALACTDLYALSVKRHLVKPRLVRLFTVGDGIVGLLLFMAATASGGIFDRFSREIHICSINPCASFITSSVFAFISFTAISPSFFLNFSSCVS